MYLLIEKKREKTGEALGSAGRMAFRTVEYRDFFFQKYAKRHVESTDTASFGKARNQLAVVATVTY